MTEGKKDEENKTLPTCFVIQSFDGETFDRRYKESIRPALEKAEVKPVRADEILGLNPIIDKIEKAIESASICVAEVSNDNPNVWLELGYALALNRPTVILCDKSIRSKLPFDVQHRPVILYRSDSKSGYLELEESVRRNVKNELENSNRSQSIKLLKTTELGKTDLAEYEVAVLSSAFAYWSTTEGGITHYELSSKLASLNFSDVGIALGITGVLDKGLITEKIAIDTNNFNEEYKVYLVTKEGINWIHQNKDKLEIKSINKPNFDFDIEGDGVPF